jgi:hypothetical protein
MSVEFIYITHLPFYLIIITADMLWIIVVLWITSRDVDHHPRCPVIGLTVS